MKYFRSSRYTSRVISNQCIFFQAAIYKTDSACAAFLANVDTKSDATVKFNGNSYQLPAWSVSILPDCNNVVLNTARVSLVLFMYTIY